MSVKLILPSCWCMRISEAQLVCETYLRKKITSATIKSTTSIVTTDEMAATITVGFE